MSTYKVIPSMIEDRFIGECDTFEKAVVAYNERVGPDAPQPEEALCTLDLNHTPEQELWALCNKDGSLALVMAADSLVILEGEEAY